MHGIKESQQMWVYSDLLAILKCFLHVYVHAHARSCKKEAVSSSCSTNTASTSSASTSTDKAKGVGCIDKFVSQVQPITVMKGEKCSRANELLVKALTGNLLPSALLDSPEFLRFLVFFFSEEKVAQLT